MGTKHQLSSDTEHVEAIGMIALETVALEIELVTLFSRMLQIPLRVARAIVLTPRADALRVEIIQNAAEAAFLPKGGLAAADSIKRSAIEKQKASALKMVRNLTNRSLDAINYRHRVMHDNWEPGRESDNSEKTYVRKVVDGRLNPAKKDVPAGELKAHIKSLRKLIDEIIDASNEFDKNPPLMVAMRRN